MDRSESGHRRTPQRVSRSTSEHVTCHVDVTHLATGGDDRANWLLRQLQHSPDTVRVESFAMHGRGACAAELLRDVRTEPTRLIADPKKELRSFRVALSSKLGSKRARPRLIHQVRTRCRRPLLRDVLQELKAWHRHRRAYAI